MTRPAEASIMEGLSRFCARVGLGQPEEPTRLTGGAMMESWHFIAGDQELVLRRAPSVEFMRDRPYDHASEAALNAAAGRHGVTAPTIAGVLAPEDGLGSGFVMEALKGTADPKTILQTDDPERLLSECASQLARIHSLDRSKVPADVPVMDYREAISKLRAQFEETGGDRPIIALGLAWLEKHCPDPIEPVLNHGDFRLGNLLVRDGWLTGVLDWELAHFGDYHEDLAFGCLPVWRFSRHDRPALGLGKLEYYFDAYESNGGRPVDPTRFRFWTVYRMVWWALGCLGMAQNWRSGEDRMLERVVISRRTSEQELDLLMLLDEDVPTGGLDGSTRGRAEATPVRGEATTGELAAAVREWVNTIKPLMEGHDRFQHAVARNALSIIERSDNLPAMTDRELAQDLLSGSREIDAPLMERLRHDAMEKLAADMPKYPSLAVARKRWTGKD